MKIKLFTITSLLLITILACTTSKNEVSKHESVEEKAIEFDYKFYGSTGEERDVALIFLGGSGDVGVPKYYDYESFTKAGYNSLALAYIDSPWELFQIPLERFKEAIDMYRARPEIEGKRIVIIGTSKGAEAALLLASIYPEIEGVVCRAPSSVVYNGITPISTSSWTLNGQDVPYLPFAPNDASTWATNNTVDFYRECLSQKEFVEKSLIKAEKINGPVLLISGKEDILWPSSQMGESVIKRLKDNNFPFKYNHIVYKDAGHTLNEHYMVGGTESGNRFAREDELIRTLEFLGEM